jgi:protease-4
VVAGLKQAASRVWRSRWVGLLGRVARRTWKIVDGGRKVLVNLLVVVIVIAALVALFAPEGPDYADQNALLVAPSGTLVEQVGSDPMSKLLEPLGAPAGGEVLLKDLVDTLEAAATDERIDVVVLELSKLSGGGLTKLQDLGDAIEAFRESGKRVIATADNYRQGAYYVAAHADEVYLHPLGGVAIEGFGRYRTYYADALERLEVDWNVFKVGTFKSAVEPFMRGNMSPEAKEANMAYLGDIWRAYLEDVAAARTLDAANVRDYAENFDYHVARAKGDEAEAALAAGLVDKLMSREEVREVLIDLVGEDEEKHTYHSVPWRAYLADHRRRNPERKHGDAVGVVVARGAISGGKKPPGSIGGDSLSALLREARHDEEIKAVVLRVDSPGGGVFGSEVIRRELALVREAGKPVVISMGSLAASGGYWISTPSDEIWAHPTTLTGSIGIFGMFPTFERTLESYAGVRVDGVGTTELAGVRPERSMPPRVQRMAQTTIERGYRRFITLVAESRGMTTDAVDAVAQGRIWSGEDAKELGLVDRLGTLDDAIARAAELAELEDPRTEWLKPKLDFKQRLMRKLAKVGIDLGTMEASAQLSPGPFAPLVHLLGREARMLAILDDPHGLYALDPRLVE